MPMAWMCNLKELGDLSGKMTIGPRQAISGLEIRVLSDRSLRTIPGKGL